MVLLAFCLFVVCSVSNAQSPPANSTALIPGSPVAETVIQQETDYYYVEVGNNTSPLTIIVTPIGDGDPDLYASLLHEYPTNAAEYIGQSYGQDAVTIPFSAYQSSRYAYIAVFGWRTSNYTIVASFETVVTLLNGVPQGGQVPHGGTDYLQYEAKKAASAVTITVLPLIGDLSVFISTENQQPEHDKPGTWFWSSGLHYQGEPIVIQANDPHFHVGMFYIAVYGVSNSTYRAQASQGGDSIALSSGIPQADHCETGEEEYFNIAVNTPGCSLTVVITPITGDPDLYMSIINPRPNSTDNTWASNLSGTDRIVINPASPATYYITAHAYRNSSFTILATVSCSSGPIIDITLIDGLPQQIYLETGQLQYFKFYVSSTSKVDVSISVSRSFGDPNIYVRTDSRASPSNYTWKADYYGDDLLTIHVTDPGYCQDCTYYITVAAGTNTSFTITASGTDHHVRLQEGVPFREDLNQYEYEYFRFDVENITEELTVTVTPLGQGDPDLYIATGNNTFPNSTHFTWSAQRLYGDAITIPHTDTNACQFCTYWISVYAFSNTTFTIVATFNNAIRLQDSVPQSGHVLRGAFTYYDYQSLGDIDVTIILTTLNGTNSLYVSTGDDYPEPGSFGWFSPSWNPIKTITIPATDSNACHNSSCYYRIGVQGNDDGDYSIVATTNGTVVLVPGVSQRAYTPQGGWKYFYTRVEQTGLDLSILVTPLSGDPDIYVSKTVERPNTTAYDQKAVRFGSDTIDYENATVGTYYIGVNAYTNSSYNILVLTFTDSAPCQSLACTITLFDGQPQEGMIHQSHYIYYSFVVSPGRTSLSFTLSKEYGDPDMYVSNDGSFPNSTNKQWASTSTQSDVITIQNPQAGRYIIGIYAYQTSQYTILASTSNGTCSSALISLQDGVVLRGSCQGQQYAYYTLSVDDSNYDLTVTVTPFSGDPDLYVSTNFCPSSNNSMWAATAYRDDSITVATTDPKYCQCQYYVAVYCYSASSYSIVSSFSQTQTLADGVPQSGTVPVEAWQYYRLRVVDDLTAVTITMTPLSGNPDLYVQINSKPNLTSSSWNATDPFTSSVIVIRASDPNFCSDCMYYVGIYGRTNASYTVVATSTVSPTIVLQNGVASRQWVDTNSYIYFSFDQPTPYQDVTIIVTPLTGDPDLYVSHLTTRPTKDVGGYEYSSKSAGADAVAITNFTNVTTWYIGVYAYMNSSFTITAYIHCDQCPPITLVNGVPQNGVLNAGVYQYYRFFLNEVTEDSRVLYVSVTRTVGDPDIYVRNDGNLPTKDYKQWYSSSFGEDVIAIQNPIPAEYDIAVYAYQTTQYSLVAHLDGTAITLSDGVPRQGTLYQGEFQYFQITVDRLDVDLTVTVTSFNGDPDLFISATNQRPNATTATWSARSPREDSITIPFTDLRLQTYYISVQGWTNCSFTIIASFSGELLLQSGVPQSGAVSSEATNYYRFTVGANRTDVQISLTAYSGTAYLYVSNFTPPVQRNTSTYQWWSTNPSSGQYLRIAHDDASGCASCVYYIGVYGRSSANYSIMAQLPGEIVVLQEGIAQRAWVDTGEYAYFVFNLNIQTADLQIAITPLSGDPDLYVSTINQRPSVSNYTWRSIASGADAINIDYLDPNFALGAYYIGIYGWQYSTFTIIATVIDINSTTSCDDPNTCPYTVLQNGVPQVGFLNQSGDRLYYEFYVANQTLVTFTVSPRYGDPDMYIRNDSIPPNSTNAMWAARSYGKDTITIQNGCTNCRYLVLIQAYSHTLYTLIGSGGDMPILLQNGIPSGTVTLPNYQWLYYYVIITSVTTDPLVISVTAFSGDPDLYISNTTDHPNSTNYVWRAQELGGDQVVINNPIPGDYYIGVYAYHNTSFSILATNGPITLVNAQPHNDQLDKGQFRDYQIFVSDPDRSDLVISLSVNQGDPVLYVGTLTNGTRPNPAEKYSYNFTTAVASQGTQRWVITIAPSAYGACDQCTYFIRVVANTTLSVFSLTATYGSTSIVILQAGKPYSATVARDRYVYFRAVVDATNYDVNIASTTFTGDIDLFVSVTSPFPNKSDTSTYNWTSWSPDRDPTSRGDSISVSHTSPNFVTGYYYIGVYGWADTSQFTITLAANETMVIPGVSQVGVLNPSGVAYFFLSVGQISDVTIGISPFNSTQSYFRYSVYVTTNNSEYPSDQFSLWYGDLVEGGDPLFIPRNCTGCTYYIGVYGAANRKFAISGSLEYTSDNLFAGRPLTGAVSSGGLKWFQVFVANASNFSVSVQTCSGNADLYMSQDSYKPDPDHFKWESVNTDKNELLEIHDPLMVNVEFYMGVKGSGAGTNQYIITANVVSIFSTAPYIRAGAIVATPNSGNIAIDFAQATSSITAPADLVYTIYWAKAESSYVMYSECGLDKIPNSQRTSFTWRDTSTLISKSIPNLQKNTKYTINVVVTDSLAQSTLYTSVTAKTSATDPPESIPLGLLLGILLPVGAVIVALVIYLIVKNRKLTKELDIEMHDTPKRALEKAAAGPKNYDKLLNEDDEETGGPSVNYAPPPPPSASESIQNL